MIKPTKFSYLLMFLAPMILSIVVNSSGTEFLLSKWLDFDHGSYNHGFLLLLVALYLIYTNINVNDDVSSQGAFAGFFLAALFMVAAFIFGAITIVSLQVVAFYLFTVFLVLAIYGWTIFKKAVVPLSLLLFALPIWDGLSPILQKLTLEMSYLMVKAVGIPVLKEGFHIIIPAGTFEVASSCSGFSYFMAAFPLAILYAVYNFGNKKNVFLVVGVIVAASIVANWIRVFIIIVAGQLTEMQHYFVTVEHFNLGWVVFGFMFISLVFFFKKVLDDKGETRYFSSMGKADVSGSENGVIARPVFLFSMLLAVLGIVFIGLQYQISENTKAFSSEKVAANISIPDVFNPSVPLYELKPKFNGAIESIYIASEYDPPVQLYHAMVVKQEQGKEIVSSDNRLFDEKLWHLVSVYDDLNDEAQKVELKSKLTGENYLLWWWYRVDSVNTTSDLKAKWYEFMGYLKGDNSASVVILLSPNKNSAESNLRMVHGEVVTNE